MEDSKLASAFESAITQVSERGNWMAWGEELIKPGGLNEEDGPHPLPPPFFLSLSSLDAMTSISGHASKALTQDDLQVH